MYSGHDSKDGTGRQLYLVLKLAHCSLFCSARASLPLNVDHEMTLPMKDGVQTYKPKFELPSEEMAPQLPADPQAAAGSFGIQACHRAEFGCTSRITYKQIRSLT